MVFYFKNICQKFGVSIKVLKAYIDKGDEAITNIIELPLAFTLRDRYFI